MSGGPINIVLDRDPDPPRQEEGKGVKCSLCRTTLVKPLVKTSFHV